MKSYKLAERMGIDFHIAITLIQRGWSILAGGATTILIPTFLSPTQQGYYYTFTSVLAIQIFFELGLNHVLTQLTSHAAAHLIRMPKNKFIGKDKWKAAILALIKMSNKWNLTMASLFFLSLLIGGHWFFSHKGTLPTEKWFYPWIVLISFTAVNLALGARLAICEGLGEVGQVARLRLIQSMIGYLMLWLLFTSGAGLWAIVAVPMASMIGTTYWLSNRKICLSFKSQSLTTTLNSEIYTYKKDVFPLQWRIAVSWISGFFIFNFITPLIFAKQGPVVAGQIGLALTIFSSISTVSASWISAKTPAFSTHIAKNERLALDSLFIHQAVISTGVTFVFTIGLLISVILINLFTVKISQRLPSLTVLSLLSLITVANSIIFSLATYIRAHKEEPLMLQSISTALLIGVGTYLLANQALEYVITFYTSVIIFFSLPWCLYIFLKYRRTGMLK